MSVSHDPVYDFARAEREAVRAVAAGSDLTAAIHQELSLRYTGRALAGLFERAADRVRGQRTAPAAEDGVSERD